jgi:N-acetylglucosamine kinase-like BadF-type ATPase
LLPSARLRVVNDMRIVLAASGLDAGIALNAGTGSIAYGWSADARECRAGGWGHLLGDEGSAYWIAKEAIRDLLYDADRGLELRPMQRELLERSGSASPLELVHRFHENREPAQWARLAPLVFDGADRDPAAQRIVEQAAAVLGGLVETVRRRLGAELPVVLAGGLLLSMDRLREDVSRLVPGEVTVLREPPVLGAVRLAAELMR